MNPHDHVNSLPDDRKHAVLELLFLARTEAKKQKLILAGRKSHCLPWMTSRFLGILEACGSFMTRRWCNETIAKLWEFTFDWCFEEFSFEKSDALLMSLFSSGRVSDWCGGFSVTRHAKENKRMAETVELFRDGEAWAVRTTCVQAADFLRIVAVDLQGLSTMGKLPDDGLVHWLPQIVEIACKLKGYKGDVFEERRIMAGIANINEATRVTVPPAKLKLAEKK